MAGDAAPSLENPVVIGPNDKVLLVAPKDLSPEQFEAYRKFLDSYFPPGQVVVVAGLDAYVVRGDDG